MVKRKIRVIVSISDIHFGAMPAKELYKQLRCVFLRTIRKFPVIDLITIDGDLFHTKVSLESEHSKYAFIFMQNVIAIAKEKGAAVRIIKGTKYHDGTQLDNMESLKSHDVDFKIIRTVCDEEIGDLSILYLPEEYMKDQDEYYEDYFNNKGKYNIIVGHGLFEETSFSKNNGEIQMRKAPVYSVDIMNYINRGPTIFGHIHTATNIRNSVFYTGSFSRWIYGEEKEKQFLITLLNVETDDFTIIPVENYLALDYITKDITNIVYNHTMEEVAKGVVFYKRKHNIYKLRLKAKFIDDSVYLDKLLILKKYFDNIENIDTDFDSNKITKEEESEELEFDYLFDKSISEVEKVSQFIKQQYSYTISPERISALLKIK